MLGVKLYAQLCGTKLVHCVIKELECLFNGAKQLVEKKVLSGFSDLVISVQQGPIVSLMINVHHSRGLSTCAHQLLASTRSGRWHWGDRLQGSTGGSYSAEGLLWQEGFPSIL